MKCRHYFLSLSMLLSVMFFGSCQTDLVAPQTNNANMAVSQNLTVPNNNNSFSSSLQENESENESPIIGKIVARRDRPETWDDLGDIQNSSYYNKMFEETPEVQAIFYDEKCEAFVGVINHLTDDEMNYVKVADRSDSGDSGLTVHMIRQPHGESPTCLEWLRDKLLVYFNCHGCP